MNMIWRKRLILYKSFSLSLIKARGQFVDDVSLFPSVVWRVRPGSPGRQGSGSRRQTICGGQWMDEVQTATDTRNGHHIIAYTKYETSRSNCIIQSMNCMRYDVILADIWNCAARHCKTAEKEITQPSTRLFLDVGGRHVFKYRVN